MKFTILGLTLLFSLSLSAQVRIPGPGGAAPAGGGGGTPTLDKNNSTAVSVSGSPPTQTVSMNATAGTVVVVQVFWCDDVSCATTAATTDVALSDGTNTYTAAQFCGTATTHYGQKIFYVQSAAGGSLTLTATFATGTGWYASTSWSSWTGMATSSVLDQTVCAEGASGTTLTATTGNLGQSNELVMGFGVGGAVTVGAGFTGINDPQSGHNVKDEYQVTGTSGSPTSATFTQASHIWNMITATFKHQ